jgi:hypothetical protein
VSGMYGADMVHFANTSINISTNIIWATEVNATTFFNPDGFNYNGVIGLTFTPINNVFD